MYTYLFRNVIIIIFYVSYLVFLLLINYGFSSIKFGKRREEWQRNWRLPEAVTPYLYDLRIEPFIEEETFDGEVGIHINVNTPTDHIVLHSNNLTISELAVHDLTTTPNSTEIEIVEWLLVPNLEFLVIRLKDHLETDRTYHLAVNYSGAFSGRLNGFYLSRYNSDNVTKMMASTQFEPNYARMAFPCFDEPAMKAAFNVEIVKPSKDYSVLSNMPVLSEDIHEEEKGSYLVKFERSPVMSTYTLVWILSDFQVLEQDVTSSGVIVRGLGRKGHEGSLKYATQATKNALDFFQQYLSVDYDLPKLDIIGIPDYSSGAMENWGMVTFKETNIIINPVTGGYQDYYSVSNVVCHEIAHMWFGNSVTMKWWNDIWLNEGFATYLSMKCTKALQPEFNVDQMAYILKKLSAFAADTPLNSRAVVSNISHNDQISSTLNEIVYRKGYSILEMFEDTLGPENFRQGLSNYLKMHSLGVVESKDLIDCLNSTQTERDLTPMMTDWVHQPGYPLVTVDRQGDRLVLTQKRFTFKDRESDKQYPSSKWDIPVKYRTGEEPGTTHEFFFNKNEEYELPLNNDTDWYKLNMGGVGFYRVNYPQDIWKKFQLLLEENSPALSEWSDRANLLEDSCQLALTGHINYSTALSMISYLGEGEETSYAPWKVASKCLNDIKKRLPSNSTSYALYTGFVKNLTDASLQKILDSTNKNKSSPFDFDQANEVIFSLACAFKHPDALSKAGNLFSEWLNGTKRINPDIKTVVFRYGVGGENEMDKWERVWNLYQETDDPHELRNLRVALTSVKNNTLLRRLLYLSRDETLVRSQDYYAILSTLAGMKKTNCLVWKLFKNDYQHLDERFNKAKVSKLFESVTSNFHTKKKLKEMKAFIKAHPQVVPQKENLKKIEEHIQNNMNWKERNEENIEEWLQQRNQQLFTTLQLFDKKTT